MNVIALDQANVPNLVWGETDLNPTSLCNSQPRCGFYLGGFFYQEQNSMEE